MVPVCTYVLPINSSGQEAETIPWGSQIGGSRYDLYSLGPNIIYLYVCLDPKGYEYLCLLGL